MTWLFKMSNFIFNMIQVKYLTWLAAVAIALVGCDAEEPLPEKLFVKEIYDPTCFKNEFAYTEGRLVQYRTKFGDRVAGVIDFYYEGSLLKRIESTSDNGQAYLISLEYDDRGRRSKEAVTWTQFDQITYTSMTDFTYDDDGNLIKKYSTYSDSTYSFPTETSFQWDNGNLVGMKRTVLTGYGPWLVNSWTLVYDNNRNYTNQNMAFVYTSVRGSDFNETLLSKNNLVVQLDGSFEEWSNEYSYNESGYPISYVLETGGQMYNPRFINYE